MDRQGSEGLVSDFMQSRHSTVRLRINLTNLCANFTAIAARVPNSTVAAVVKANAYGLGLQRVGRALADVGCRAFFVANMSEALSLRSVVHDAVIYVLEGVSDDPQAALAHRLTPVLNTLDEWRAWKALAADLPWCLQLDTGIGRAGINATQWFADPQAIGDMARHPQVCLLSQWACADEPAHPINDAQWAVFQAMHRSVPHARTSLANSAGLMMPAERVGDLVRPGLALYGGQPLAHPLAWIKPVVTVEARVLQTKELSQDCPVGYGATETVRAGSTLITLGLGYTDGFARERVQRGVVLFEGHRYPVVGRISMDLTTVVKTAPDQPTPSVGAWMTVVGCSGSESITLEDLAHWTGRSNHSLLTGWNALVERVYD